MGSWHGAKLVFLRRQTDRRDGAKGEGDAAGGVVLSEGCTHAAMGGRFVSNHIFCLYSLLPMQDTVTDMNKFQFNKPSVGIGACRSVYCSYCQLSDREREEKLSPGRLVP